MRTDFELTARRRGRSRKLLGLLLCCWLALGQGTALAEQPLNDSVQDADQEAPSVSTQAFTLDYRSDSHSSLLPFVEGIAPGGANQAPAKSGLEHRALLRVQGTAEISAYSVPEDEAWLLFRMPSVRAVLNLDGQVAQAESDELARQLKEGVFFTRARDGSITRVWLERGASKVSIAAIKRLLSYTQAVRPPLLALDATHWEVRETDPSGTFVTQYRKLGSDSSGVTYVKTKKTFVAPSASAAGAKALMTASYLPQGEMRLRFSSDGAVLRSVVGSETQRATVAGKEAGKSRSTFSMVQVKQATPMAAYKLLAQLSRLQLSSENYQAVPLFDPPSRQAISEQLYRQKLGTATAQDLRSELEVAERSGSKSPDQTELYLKLKALLYLQPQSCLEFANLILDKPVAGISYQMVVGALAAIASPQAQDALLLILDTKKNSEPDALPPLIVSLGMMAEPTARSQTALMALALHARQESVASTAQLALGVMAHTLAKSDSARADHIMDELVAHLESDHNPEQLHVLLLAMGNAGLSQHMSKLLSYLADPSADIRADAAYSLRHYPLESVGDALLNMLAHDPDATSRREAVRALGSMDVSPRVIDALMAAYHAEGVAELRLFMVRTLLKWEKEKARPDIRVLVLQASEQDASDSVRKAIKELMNAYPEGYFKP